MRFFLPCATICLALFSGVSISLAEEDANTEAATESAQDIEQHADAAAAKSSEKKSAESAASKAPEHVALLKDATPITGLFKMHRKDDKLYCELSSAQYNSEYLVLISIARGIGDGMLLGGMTWNMGDEWVWKFRKVDNRVHILRKNTRFRAKDGSPEATALKYAYSDSVLFSMPVITKGPGGGDLVDLSSVFMSDLPQISHSLPGFVFSASKSTYDSIKPFPDNVELRVAATYASSGRTEIESVADSRGVTVTVHYSISKLPATGYQPRLADDRVGYFLTVAKDYSSHDEEDQFRRYINRWDLRKADSDLDLSPPKPPLVFWIENTVPFKYRKTIREAILEWNRAFEQAGFVDAIEVRQQPDKSDWDPEDINYNTIRWITSGASFAGIGPTRKNPYTGQILDADILLDSASVRSYDLLYETLTPSEVTRAVGGPFDMETFRKQQEELQQMGRARPELQCRMAQGMSRQLALGTSVLVAKATPEERSAEVEKLVLQALKAMTMHEVGHTLGLRHNFKSSSFLSLEEINDVEKTRVSGMIASVMDYDPVNLMPEGSTQGDYFTTTIGPYDVWAIEYGYKPFPGGTKGEVAELQKIAARSGEPGLAYSTDEDARGIDPDPSSGLFELGNDAIEFAKNRAQLVRESIPGLVERLTDDGDTYAKLRRALNSLLHHHGAAALNASRYVGGIHISRSHKGDNDAPQPLVIVDVEKQRETLAFLEAEVFSDKPFQLPPELYNLALSSRWSHWGVTRTPRPDFPVHMVILSWQDLVLYRLMSSLTLERILDNELKTPPEEDAMTVAELLDRLTNTIFNELEAIEDREFTNRQPAISSLRRNLQRSYLSRLGNIALGRTFAPDDAQTLAYAELASLGARIANFLANDRNLDVYTRAHLEETAARIEKIRDARMTPMSP